MQSRIVSISEINSCPFLRLDAKHYLPKHNTLADKLSVFLGTLNAEEKRDLDKMLVPVVPSLIQLFERWDHGDLEA